jgi:hypothetical protein
MTRALKMISAVAMIAITLASMAVAVYLLVKAKRDEIVVDAHLCPVSKPIAGHVIVAVDWTDPLTQQQREALKDIIIRTKREIAVGELLSLHTITGNVEDSGTPVFSLCKPLDPDNINPLIENERRLRDKWNLQFGKPLDVALDRLLKGSSAPESPILESIDSIMWQHNFQGDLPHRSLMIFSDLIQNTPDQSHYRSIQDSCAVLRTPLGRKLKAKDWRNLRLVFHYWRNPKAQNVQGPEHLVFWTRLFGNVGVQDIRVGNRPVEYDLADPKCGEVNSSTKIK